MKPVGPAGEVSCESRGGVQTTLRVSLEGPCWKELGLPGVFTVEVALLCIQTQGLWLGRLGGMLLEFVHARGEPEFVTVPWRCTVGSTRTCAWSVVA
jgi:hypothetical protein